MHLSVVVPLVALALIAYAVNAQQYDDASSADEDFSLEKRAAMRNALVRFGRAAPSGGMRNALVRFGKRSAPNTVQDKRNGQPQPFVRFGRASSTPTTKRSNLFRSSAPLLSSIIRSPVPPKNICPFSPFSPNCRRS
ncbi:unnamed protein product, partial [Mesorhabditis spiculigera]